MNKTTDNHDEMRFDASCVTEDRFKMFSQAAEQGDVMAQYNLGYYYLSWLGNERLGIEWLTKAATQGLAIAQYMLGFYYLYETVNYDESYFLNFFTSDEDRAKAELWLTKAAEQGLAEAQYELGNLYYDYYCISQRYSSDAENLNKAIAWFSQAAEQGKDEAVYILYQYYRYKGDYAQAIAWLTRSAEQGNYNAQYDLGNHYYHGIGLDQDYEKAVYWYNKAAQQGYSMALRDLGICYAAGRGVVQDYTKAFELLTKSAKKDKDFITLSNLGKMYEEGLGVNKDLRVALIMYRKASVVKEWKGKVGASPDNYCEDDQVEKRECDPEKEHPRSIDEEYYNIPVKEAIERLEAAGIK